MTELARGSNEGTGTRAVQIGVSVRALLLVVAVVLAVWALFSISQALLLIVTGVFLAFVFEFPLRLLMEKTRLGRGLAATILVLGAALLGGLLALLLAVPLLRGIRDLLKELPQLADDARESDELGWLGDTTAADHVEDGANNLADTVPFDLSELAGVAGNVFGLVLGIFTVVFVALFVLIDMPKIKDAVTSLAAVAALEHESGLAISSSKAATFGYL